MKRILAYITLISLLTFIPAVSEAASVSPAVAAEGAHALYLDKNGTVWAWGSNQRGESNPANPDARVTVPESVLENVLAVACGQQFSMAIDRSRALLMWGDNRLGQIPSFEGERAASPVKAAEGVLQIAACDARAALVTEDGKAYLWGDGCDMTLVAENAAMISVGTDFALILGTNGDVYELQGDIPASAAAAERIPVLRGCAFISASGQTRLAVTAEGELYAWGASGDEGRLGLERRGWVSEPARVEIPSVSRVRAGLTSSAAFSSDGQMWIWGSVYSYATHMDENGNALGAVTEGELIHYGSAPVSLYTDVTDITFGDAFVVALMDDGALRTWGSNDQGQIGDGTCSETVLEPAEDDEDDEVHISVSEQRVFPVTVNPGA